MASLNKVFLIGNLVRDPELRSLRSGQSVCEFRLALSRSIGEREEVCYVDVSAWGKAAVACGKYLRKGSCVHIEGHLTLSQWEDKQTGYPRNKLTVTAENVQFINTPKNGETRGTTHNPRNPEASSGHSTPPPPISPDDPAIPPVSPAPPVEDDIPF